MINLDIINSFQYSSPLSCVKSKGYDPSIFKEFKIDSRVFGQEARVRKEKRLSGKIGGEGGGGKATMIF